MGGVREAQTERILSKMDPNHVQGGSRLTDGVGTEYRVVQEQPLIAIHPASTAFRINKQTPAMRFSHGRLDAQYSQTNALQKPKKAGNLAYSFALFASIVLILLLIPLKIIGVPAIDGLATNWGRNADAQAESATAVSD